MKAVEVKFLEKCNEKSKLAIAQIVESATCLEDIIQAWFFKAKQNIEFSTGYDDVDDSHVCCIIFKYRDNEVAEVYYKPEVLRDIYSEAVLISNYFLDNKDSTHMNIDEQGLGSWKEKIGFKYSDALCGYIAPKDAISQFTLAYFLTNGGEVDLNHVTESNFFDDDDVECLEEEGLKIKDLIKAYYGYRAPKAINGIMPGFGGTTYFRK